MIYLFESNTQLQKVYRILSPCDKDERPMARWTIYVTLQINYFG